MKKSNKNHSFIYRNSLSLVFLILFFISFALQIKTGFNEHNDLLSEYNKKPQSLTEYFKSGHFIEATFENWESEFLQMGLFVVFTIFLRQQGSSESKDCDEPVFDKEELKAKPDSPMPVKKGGFILSLFKHSLSISLFLLFAISFILHWLGSWMSYNEEQTLKGHSTVSIMEHLGSSTFWFESFQNWQSEFLSIFAIIFLSIYLRQYGSSQSKAVNDSNYKTGE